MISIRLTKLLRDLGAACEAVGLVLAVLAEKAELRLPTQFRSFRAANRDPESSMAASSPILPEAAILKTTPVWTALRWQGVFFTALAGRGAHVSGLNARLRMAAGPDAIRAGQVPPNCTHSKCWGRTGCPAPAVSTGLLRQFCLPFPTRVTPWGAISQAAASSVSR